MLSIHVDIFGITEQRLAFKSGSKMELILMVVDQKDGSFRISIHVES